MPVPLSVLDLSPVPSGGTASDAFNNTLRLAKAVESFGYKRYWLAEHHLVPGVISSAPAVLGALVAGATRTLRVGSGAVLLGHQTALSVVEQFGLLDVAFPGRIDLGIGRSGAPRLPGTSAAPARSPQPAHEVDGLVIPEPFAFTLSGELGERIRTQLQLLTLPGAQSPGFAAQVDDVLAFVNGSFTTESGHRAHAVPGEGADLQVWVLGSSGGESARVAGERGLPFAANYHVTPSNVLDAVAAYREAFRPSQWLDEPYVVVSADAVVAETSERARELASPYGLWVRSIRAGGGAIPYPSPKEAAEHEWSDEDRKLVADRVSTQFVGTPAEVVERLQTLQRVTGADELVVTTVTHDHVDRERSYELLAAAWASADEGPTR
ncbi:luciferase family oxidoreductase group 1 [Motilibacter peucedani]|uniref:Luciferase family oxidoreductase group 1 n=1 Tax=Motilibacter peucedani TaxID=598650 RepID=A0A420XJX6_9ACTN|nr:MsnO8 family LLM class oxidoreductase [Motilibacter peucedani]RKS68451.1 luciferase family oxidoreductase group 1 [Motilibacter peucedani]